jgi:hypothetical protein
METRLQNNLTTRGYLGVVATSANTDNNSIALNDGCEDYDAQDEHELSAHEGRIDEEPSQQ